MEVWWEREAVVIKDYAALEQELNSRIEKNDFEAGYDDSANEEENKGTSEQYKEGYKMGSRFKGK